MPVPTDGLLEFTLHTSVGTEQFQNVFYYHDTLNNPLVSLLGAAAAFDTTIVTPLALILSSSVSFDSIVTKDVIGGLPDIETIPVTGGGTRAGDILPDFYAYAYTLNPQTKETRRGAKRFSGATELDVLGNSPTVAFRVILTTYAIQMTIGLVVVNTYSPCVYGRVTPTRPVHVVNYLVGVVPNQFVTTQSSRKVR